MSDIDDDSSGSEYLPMPGDDGDFTSGKLYLPGQYEPVSLPIQDDGWTFMANPLIDQRPDILPDFTAPLVGIKPGIPQFTCPREAFCFFFDDTVIDKLALWMNERAAQYFTITGRRKVNGRLWKPAGRDDMYLFLSLLMVMGINKLPRNYMYWSADVMFGGPKIFCREVMPRAKFLCLLKFMRFAPYDQIDKKRPRTRIEPFLDLLRINCQRFLHPGQHIAIDEALILYRGRLGFKQFIRTKRARFGIKVFVLCPSASQWAGYSWNFEIYYGKDSTFNNPDPAAVSLTTSELVVSFLMKAGM